MTIKMPKVHVIADESDDDGSIKSESVSIKSEVDSIKSEIESIKSEIECELNVENNSIRIFDKHVEKSDEELIISEGEESVKSEDQESEDEESIKSEDEVSSAKESSSSDNEETTTKKINMNISNRELETNGNVTSNSEEEADEEPVTGNAGWVDAIAKILKTKKPKNKKTLVLSKAKKLSEVRKETTESAGFEVATADGEVREEKIEIQEKDQTDEPPRKKKRDLPMLRLKPSILERDRERTLTKIATKGVVHLFNAVRMQQKDISKKLEEAGPLEAKKDKVMKNIDKRAFLDVLMGEKSEKVKDMSDDVKAKPEIKTQSSTWGILRDDFMMGAKMKDWDKALDEDKGEVNMESE